MEKIDTAHWLTKTWGKLRLCPNQPLPPRLSKGCNTKFKFTCECGKIGVSRFAYVTNGSTRSCGHCSERSREFWVQQYWGELKLEGTQELPVGWGPGTERLYSFSCKCGNIRQLPFSKVVTGAHTTCGHCNDEPKSYWLAQSWGQLKLDPEQELPDGWGSGCEKQFKFICACGKSTNPRFYSVAYGVKSCGCLISGQNEFSPETIIREYVSSICEGTHPTKFSIEGTRKSYDVYVPSKKLAIEYHGLVWHSEKYNSTNRDYRKYLLAKSRGDRLIQIYSDEWENKQEIIKAQLREILAPKKKIRIKPVFEIHTKTPPEARAFLDQYHYLGAASGCVTIVARHKDEIVGVWVFMKREVGTILWHRACWHHAYKAWNPHEKALKLALPELKKLGFTRMVTFSDNRFHTGGLYEKLGFTFEKELKPDYGYTEGSSIRKSKYALRVKAGVDEIENARKKNWYRIWDSGKKRYSLAI